MRINYRIPLAVSSLFLLACGGTKTDKLTNLKTELQQLRNLQDKTADKIKKLEDELAILDTSATSSTKIKLVAFTTATVQNFKHYVDLQGKVDADNISYISPRGAGGQVKSIFIREGQYVKKGQLLLKLDDAIIQQQVTAARQQLNGIKTQLNFARNIYERQNNLWKQGIGTEVQLIQARTNVEALEDQLKAANEQVKVAVEQANTTNVYSDVNGVADVVSIRVGELFTGMTAQGPQIKIVNNTSLKVVSNIPENYISQLKKGTPVLIFFPDLNKEVSAALSLVGQSIDPTLRGFIAEAHVPFDPMLKPNQTAVMKVMNYSSENAVLVPVNAVQSDETGKYVFIARNGKNGNKEAQKVMVTIGMAYGNLIEIKTGLKGGEQVVSEGYQDIYEGQAIAD
ncbi:MAG: efflux RND transporter periplasmic adaptor subunit [Ferruginibacter sp.]|nr:efflux RND transporter periplasmic adaptor subunit [Ferruginibacter sp.]